MNGVQLKAWRESIPRQQCGDTLDKRHSPCITQQQLADMLGVTVRTVLAWENGAKPISKLVAHALRHLKRELKVRK